MVGRWIADSIGRARFGGFGGFWILFCEGDREKGDREGREKTRHTT